MPVIYRIRNADKTKAVFFAKKGEGSKAKRDHKKATGENVELEMLRVNGRDGLVELLNDPCSNGGAEPDAPATDDDEDNEFI